MKHPSTIRRYIRRLEARRGGGVRESAAIEAMIATLRWVVRSGDAKRTWDPISNAVDAMIEDHNALEQESGVSDDGETPF